jgi:hypothetical protein
MSKPTVRGTHPAEEPGVYGDRGIGAGDRGQHRDVQRGLRDAIAAAPAPIIRAESFILTK